MEQKTPTTPPVSLLTIAIRATRNVFKAVHGQIAQKGTIPGMAKIAGTYLAFKRLGVGHQKGPAVWHPRNAIVQVVVAVVVVDG